MDYLNFNKKKLLLSHDHTYLSFEQKLTHFIYILLFLLLV